MLRTRLFVGFVFFVGAIVLCFWMASEVFEGETQIFDGTIRDSIHQLANPALTQLMIIFSFVGSVIFLLVSGLIIICFFLYFKWYRAAILFGAAIFGEQIINLTLKIFYQRVRPEAFFDYPLPLSYSFPSGHALGSFCFYAILAWIISPHLKHLPAKFTLWIFAFSLIFLIGFSRVYLGVHYPSDVIAGYLAGFLWCFILIIGDLYLQRNNTELQNIK